jgi:pyruvate/2-oxoglutarate dehydrogenase complex dihydrolipoamide dehydrogenase (E3) component
VSDYDLAIIGAGSGGLTAAGFAARLGARVALIEKNRIGGDCTWTGCVPSKALLKAAKVAHESRRASLYGVVCAEPAIDMSRVREYVERAIQQVYQAETPEQLQRQGVDVIFGAARFTDPHGVDAGGRSIRAKKFLIATGARPKLPAIDGLDGVPFVTYEQIFENDRLPGSMLVAGGGPIGVELAQAYQRLGSQVTIVAEQLLPREEPEAREVIERVFAGEGLKILHGRAVSARREGGRTVVSTTGGDSSADLLLIAVGRKPSVNGLDLEKAGVHYSEMGIQVDRELRTNVKHIYAAGDVTGSYQFTHYAGWQAFQAVRNALLPGAASGISDIVPWVTFTDPEVAHVGLTEADAQKNLPGEFEVWRWDMSHTDRAICENDAHGFIKVVAKKDGTILGATVVAGRAGETITEFILAMKHGLKAADLAGAIHAYPTYSTAAQQLAAEIAIEGTLSGGSGRLLRGLSKLIR